MANPYYVDKDLDNNFPVSIDNFNKFEDLQISDLSAVNQYYSLYNAGKMIEAQAVLASNPSLKNKIINAENLNKLRDAVVSMELFYLEDVHDYITNVVKDKGNWFADQTYKKYNVVRFYEPYLKSTLFYMAIQDVPKGTEPTNADYWEAITMSGYSPTVRVEITEDGHKIITEDLEGSQEVNIIDPHIEIIENNKSSHTIKVTDMNGEQSFDLVTPTITTTHNADTSVTLLIQDAFGSDNYKLMSPLVEASDIVGGHRITVKDINGEETFNLFDGVGLKVRGEWDSTETYEKDDCVTYNSALWGAKKTNTRQTPSIDNTSNWYLIFDAADIAVTTGTLLYRGQIDFASLSYQKKMSGYMYIITDEFITDDTFINGAGTEYPAYTCVHWTTSGKWACLSSPSVANVRTFHGDDVETAIANGDLVEDDVFIIDDDNGDGIIYVDSEPTEGSFNVVSSDGIFNALKSIVESLLQIINDFQDDVRLEIKDTKDKFIVLNNVTPTWNSDTTYTDYPYKGTIVYEGITEDYFPMVNYSNEQLNSEQYSSICETTTNKIYIYAATNDVITIPNITCIKADN